MTRRVLDTFVFDKWIEKHNPHAMSKLAVGADVGLSSLHRMRSTGTLPHIDTMDSIARFMELKLEKLFPIKDV